ncbi:MAG: hypothetical protein WAV32_01735 [Halobacteriota archaeon]
MVTERKMGMGKGKKIVESVKEKTYLNNILWYKFQTPNHKYQTIPNIKIPIFKTNSFAAYFEIGNLDLFGILCLRFGIFHNLLSRFEKTIGGNMK